MSQHLFGALIFILVFWAGTEYGRRRGYEDAGKQLDKLLDLMERIVKRLEAHR